jgi:hypothetical protein
MWRCRTGQAEVEGCLVEMEYLSSGDRRLVKWTRGAGQAEFF